MAKTEPPASKNPEPAAPSTAELVRMVKDGEAEALFVHPTAVMAHQGAGWVVA